MRRHVFAVVFVGTMVVLAGCETPATVALGPINGGRSSAQTPSDGSGNKVVVAVDFTDAVTCPNGTDLTRHVTGWIQERVFNQDGNRNVVLDVFHIDFIFTNVAGESYVWHEVGPDLLSLENGDLMLLSVGRIGGTVIGVFKRNLSTGEVVLLAGKEVPPRFILACDALT